MTGLGTVTVTNSTVTGNSAIRDAGGIYNHDSALMNLTYSDEISGGH